MTKTFAVLGAAGGVGRCLVDQALTLGHRVRAIEPEWPEADRRDGLELRTADVLSDDLSGCFDGVDAVLSCLGVGNAVTTLLNPPPLYTQGTTTILRGMHQAGVRRLIVISASFVEAKNRGPLYFRLPVMASLHNVLDQMAEMEAQLRVSDVDWTAVRPGWLMDGALTGDYTVTANVIPEDLIRTRMADVAHFMLDLAENGGWSRQTPALARKEEPQASSLSTVVKELIG